MLAGRRLHQAGQGEAPAAAATNDSPAILADLPGQTTATEPLSDGSTGYVDVFSILLPATIEEAEPSFEEAEPSFEEAEPSAEELITALTAEQESLTSEEPTVVVGVFLGECIWVGGRLCQLSCADRKGQGRRAPALSRTPGLCQVYALIEFKARISSLSTCGPQSAQEPQQ